MLGILNGDTRFTSTYFTFCEGMTQFACRKPMDVPGALVISVRDLAKAIFPHNTKLVYICQPGRRMKGESAERKCVNGIWTEVRFKCESKYVSTHRNKSLRLVRESNSQPFDYSSSALAHCFDKNQF